MMCRGLNRTMSFPGTKSANADSVKEVFNLNDHDRRTVFSGYAANCSSAVVSVHNDCW
jgi:hypothetical protein